MIHLTLKYSISSNRYWCGVIIKGHAVLVPTKDAQAYRGEVAWLAKAADIRHLHARRAALTIRLVPAPPQDWTKRTPRPTHVRRHGALHRPGQLRKGSVGCPERRGLGR